MLQGWVTADYLQATQIVVSVIEILITAFVAIWVVQSVQTKIDSEKVLKDFFSGELIQLRADLRSFLDKLIRREIEAQSIKRDHNLLRVRINDLLSALNKKFKIDKKYLGAYRQNLLKIVEGDENYVKGFASNEKVQLKEETINRLQKLRTENDHLFNDILIELYDSK